MKYRADIPVFCELDDESIPNRSLWRKYGYSGVHVMTNSAEYRWLVFIYPPFGRSIRPEEPVAFYRTMTVLVYE